MLDSKSDAIPNRAPNIEAGSKVDGIEPWGLRRAGRMSPRRIFLLHLYSTSSYDTMWYTQVTALLCDMLASCEYIRQLNLVTKVVRIAAAHIQLLFSSLAVWRGERRKKSLLLSSLQELRNNSPPSHSRSHSFVRPSTTCYPTIQQEGVPNTILKKENNRDRKVEAKKKRKGEKGGG